MLINCFICQKKNDFFSFICPLVYLLVFFFCFVEWKFTYFINNLHKKLRKWRQQCYKWTRCETLQKTMAHFQFHFIFISVFKQTIFAFECSFLHISIPYFVFSLGDTSKKNFRCDAYTPISGILIVIELRAYLCVAFSTEF